MKQAYDQSHSSCGNLSINPIKDSLGITHILFSMHSSLSEGLKLIELLNPRQVIPTVTPIQSELRNQNCVDDSALTDSRLKFYLNHRQHVLIDELNTALEKFASLNCDAKFVQPYQVCSKLENKNETKIEFISNSKFSIPIQSKLKRAVSSPFKLYFSERMPKDEKNENQANINKFLEPKSKPRTAMGSFRIAYTSPTINRHLKRLKRQRIEEVTKPIERFSFDLDENLCPGER